ncbi:Tetratricopeptide repeat protein [Thalictrum thalictroides]|uniref:Tetratricopeptide repeat protein n=1 Tax=Thalictrum thalictroides TaxID=46969 RepID=A0A7J6WTM8_THATH|nr:Tetratricopeptide repeat protein [Thalictrum thalictroides]
MEWKKKKTTKSNKRLLSTVYQNLPFDNQNEEEVFITTQRGNTEQQNKTLESSSSPSSLQNLDLHLVQVFQTEGNKLAENGRYKEALGKWEAALTLVPDRAVLHEQKAQVLLEIGDSWNALKAATRATELEPSWAEAWITLARTQLNYGEPDASIESFDRALAIKPDSKEAQGDRQTAMHLVKRRKQLHLSGLSATENRYSVGDRQNS